MGRVSVLEVREKKTRPDYKTANHTETNDICFFTIQTLEETKVSASLLHIVTQNILILELGPLDCPYMAISCSANYEPSVPVLDNRVSGRVKDGHCTPCGAYPLSHNRMSFFLCSFCANESDYK